MVLFSHFTPFSRFCARFALYKPTAFVFGAVVSDEIVLCFCMEEKGGSMPTQEERLATLERRVATNYSEISHHLTMLLGMAMGQDKHERPRCQEPVVIIEYSLRNVPGEPGASATGDRENSKSEFRNPKQIQNSKEENPKQ